MLVWVASYPRSGNSLTMLVLRDVFGIGRIGTVFLDDLDLGRLRRALPPASAEPWKPPPELRGLPKSDLLAAIRERPEPFFIKTHRLSEAADPAPALYIVRDGRDALVSHAHFVADRDGFAQLSFEQRLARLIRAGIPTRGNWSQNVRAWRERAAPTAVTRFEDLVGEPAATVAAACRDVNVHLGEPEGELPAFADARAQMPRIYRRGQVGAWRDEMSRPLEARFWALHGEEMERLGYAR